jgi:tripartite motif-containing protein 71
VDMATLKWLSIVLFLGATILGCEDSSPEPVPAPRYISSFGTWGNDDGEFEWPRAIAVGPDSLLYVGDTGNKRIEIFTNLGEFVRQWPIAGAPSLIALAPDSSVYVALNYGRNLGRYTNDGQLITPLNFVNVVAGFEVDASGNLYVCGLRVYGPDPFNPFVEGPYFWKFNPQQELIKKWGYPGSRDTTGWSGGRMTWNTKGNLLVLGEIDSTTAVFEFTPDGDPVSIWRIPSIESHLLEDIACDHSGKVLITSPFKSLVYMFDSRGRLLTEWNELDEHHEPLSQPAGIAVDKSGFLYVVDYVRYWVVKYEPSP